MIKIDLLKRSSFAWGDMSEDDAALMATGAAPLARFPGDCQVWEVEGHLFQVARKLGKGKSFIYTRE